MTLRRLALALALLSAPVDADDFDDLTSSDAERSALELALTQRASTPSGRLEDLLLRADGSIAGAVGHTSDAQSHASWSLLRLVLADVDDGVTEDEELVWIQTAPARRDAEPVSQIGCVFTDAEPLHALTALTGVAVVGPNRESIGVVRGALVCWSTGRVLALAVEVNGYLGSQSRTIALPWAWLRIPDDVSAGLPITSEADPSWIQSAPPVALTHVLR